MSALGPSLQDEEERDLVTIRTSGGTIQVPRHIAERYINPSGYRAGGRGIVETPDKVIPAQPRRPRTVESWRWREPLGEPRLHRRDLWRIRRRHPGGGNRNGRGRARRREDRHGKVRQGPGRDGGRPTGRHRTPRQHSLQGCRRRLPCHQGSLQPKTPHSPVPVRRGRRSGSTTARCTATLASTRPTSSSTSWADSPSERAPWRAQEPLEGLRALPGHLVPALPPQRAQRYRERPMRVARCYADPLPAGISPRGVTW